MARSRIGQLLMSLGRCGCAARLPRWPFARAVRGTRRGSLTERAHSRPQAESAPLDMASVLPPVVLGLLSVATADDGDVMTSVGERKHAHDDESDEPAPQARAAARCVRNCGARSTRAHRMRPRAPTGAAARRALAAARAPGAAAACAPLRVRTRRCAAQLG